MAKANVKDKKVKKAQKETPEQVLKQALVVAESRKMLLLKDSFSQLFDLIIEGIEYHSRRADFFKKSNFILKSIDAVVGIGALVAIGTQKTGEIFTSENLLFSLSVAGLAVFLLYFGVLCDFSKKEETHRWLLSSYLNLNKEVSIYNLIDWRNLTNEQYVKYRSVHERLYIDLDGLRKEEQPILKFLNYLAGLHVSQGDRKAIPAVNKISWFRFFLADYFSMPNFTLKIKNLEFAMKEEEKTNEEKSGVRKGDAGKD